MAQATANCQECGQEMVMVNKKRKYCGECQVVRDVTWAPKRKINCEVCDEVFWPIRTSYKRCTDCASFRANNPERHGECVKCHKNYRPAPGVEATCVKCVQGSEKMRDAYVKTLLRRRKERINVG